MSNQKNQKSQSGAMDTDDQSQEPCWTFLSNHALVTMCLVDDPFMRMRDIAIRVGITERAVQRILTELEAGGYITRHRDGRRNRYTVHLNQSIGHPLTGSSSIFDLMKLHVRRNGGTDPSTDLYRPMISRAANGTSFGRRRGPVARPAPESNGHANGSNHDQENGSKNRINADSVVSSNGVRRRGRPRKSAQAV